MDYLSVLHFHHKHRDSIFYLVLPFLSSHHFPDLPHTFVRKKGPCTSYTFGTSAELWLNLESAYRLAHVKSIDTHTARRAKRLLAKAG